jgi:hypothetical protein
MSNRRPLVAAFLLALVFTGGCDREVAQRDGVLVRRDPIQRQIARPRRFAVDGFEVEAVAEYDIEGRVLRRHIYPSLLPFVGYAQAVERVSPLDLALGWGLMSDNAVLAQLNMFQGHRFFAWSPRSGDFALSVAEINRHSSNNHVIPASREIRAQLMALRRGDLVRLVGELVNVRSRTRSWTTSTTREDNGCEVIYVRTVERL